jgi:hypothetical protein
VNGPYKDRANVQNLSHAIQVILPTVFSQMLQLHESWVSQDSRTSFKIYAYGHALFGLNLLHVNLFNLDLNKFLSAASVFFEDDHNPKSPAFSLVPEQTWVPALYELALAFRAIRLNFDPLQYWKSGKTQTLTEVNAELAAEKIRLFQETRQIEIRQKVIDEWEKELIRARAIVRNISSVKSELVQLLNSAFDERIDLFYQQLRSDVNFYLRLSLLALLSGGYILYRIIAEKHFEPTTIDGIVAFLWFAWVIGEKLIRSRRKKKGNDVGHAS